jgi:hypothetical protein
MSADGQPGRTLADLVFSLARPAGFEPATRCLEGRFTQRVNLHVSRSEAVRSARE